LIRLSLILILILFHGLTDVEDKFVFLVAARPGVAHEIECQIVLANIFGCVELQLDVGLALEKLSIVSSLSLFEFISLVIHVNCSNALQDVNVQEQRFRCCEGLSGVGICWREGDLAVGIGWHEAVWAFHGIKVARGREEAASTAKLKLPLQPLLLQPLPLQPLVTANSSPPAYCLLRT
jgi:hypothetical protein